MLDRFPAEREEIAVERALFTIERVFKNRIVSIRCVLRDEDEDGVLAAE